MSKALTPLSGSSCAVGKTVPIVELVIGAVTESTTLYAHQALLQRSPFLAQVCEEFTPNTAVRRIELPGEDLDATSSILEYLYKDDYFPVVSGNATEYDPTVPQPDNEGIGLLRHGRVYTLAQKLGLPQLCALAHKKIHLTNSTAKGEIAYARFVYKETNPDDILYESLLNLQQLRDKILYLYRLP